MHRGRYCSTLFFPRRIFSVLAAGLLILSCSGTGDRKRTVLRVWDFKYGETGMGDAMRLYDRAFEERHPTIRVEHRALSDVDDEDVLSSALAANAAPDVVMVHSGMEFHAFMDRFAVMDEAASAALPRVIPAALAECRDASGKLRAIPLTVQGFGWYYNKRLFSRAGMDPERPPRAWADFLSACERLSSAGIRPIAWGNNPPHGSDWLRRSFAVTFYDRDELRSFYGNPASVRDERFILIASLIRGLRDSGYLDSDGACCDQILDAAERFRSGNAAMYLGLLSDISNWKEFSDALGKDAVGFFPSVDHPSAEYPGRICLQGAGIVYAVIDTSPVLEAAKQYAVGYLGDGAADRLARKTGALVALKDWSYPVEDYPVLVPLLESLDAYGDDPELFYPGLFVKSALFRFDELYYNTKEISLPTYLDSLEDSFSRSDHTIR